MKREVERREGRVMKTIEGTIDTKNIIIENEEEVAECIGQTLTNIEVLAGKESWGEAKAFCAPEEILLEFDNGTEWRIYLDEDGKLSVYSD